MKIRNQLLLSLCTLPILIVLLIGMWQFQTKAFDARSASLKDNYDALLRTEQILVDVKNNAISIRNIILFEDNELIGAEIASLEEKETEISHDIYLLEPYLNAKNPEYVGNLSRIIVELNAYSDRVISLATSGKKAEAIALINSEGNEIQNKVLQVVTPIVKDFETEMKTTLDDTVAALKKIMLWGILLAILGLIVISVIVLRVILKITSRLKNVSSLMLRVANGSETLDTKIKDKSKDEIGDVSRSFNSMVESLKGRIHQEKEQLWLKTNVTEITKNLNGLNDLESLSKTYLSMIAPLLEVCHAVFYIKDENDIGEKPVYKLLASYAFIERKHPDNKFGLGEGLVGQAALEKTPILLTNVPPDYVQAVSGLGEAAPLNVFVLPVRYKDQVNAVVEIASFQQFTAIQKALLEDTMDNLGIILENIRANIQLSNMYSASQAQLEEIQAQSEELQTQQEELRRANALLEKQTEEIRHSEEELQAQHEELEQMNVELREKTEILIRQNKELEAANAEVLSARAELEEKVRDLALSSRYKSEFLANMSHELRTPLNSLIILSRLLADNPDGNLSDKQVEYSQTIYTSASDLLSTINDVLDLSKIESGKMIVNPERLFIKDITAFLHKSFEPIALDKQIKFNIEIREGCPDSIYSDENRVEKILVNLLANAFKFTHEGEVTLEIAPAGDRIAFIVSDTGIGIPKDKLALIFEAFQQADGTKSRKYGGTGLGLSISRELAGLLGGEITVESEEGRGSTFTLYVGDYQPPKGDAETGGRADTVLDELQPAIIKETEKGIALKKSADNRADQHDNIKSVLIVDDDPAQRNSLMELIGSKDIIITAVSLGSEAIEQLKVRRYDCLILDLGLADISGMELIERINANRLNENLKIFIYTGRELTSKEEIYLKKHAHTIIIKDSFAPQRLMDELEFYLHAESEKTKDCKKEEGAAALVEKHNELVGKSILIVDDDARNVFALSSVLETYGLTVTFAENGSEAVEILKEKSGFDLILMDIMMPEMDGLEAMSVIRSMPGYKNIPIIALTAKAMKEDRSDCLKAGASDYIAKPVNPDQLISLIKVWLYHERNQ